MFSVNWVVCNSKKNKIIKKQEAIGIPVDLGIKNPLNKVRFLGPLQF